MFAVVESAAATILDKLTAGDFRLSSEECEIFCMFLSLGWSRVPRFRTDLEESATFLMNTYNEDLASDPDKFARTVAKFESESGTHLGDWEEMRRAILEKRVEVVASPEMSLKMMILSFEFLAQVIAAMKWSFRTTESISPFVTSDAPVVLNNPSMLDGESPPTPAALEVTFPITPELLFVATWDGHAGAGSMRPRLARQINKLIALSAHQYVYSSTEIPAITKYSSEPRKSLIDRTLLIRISKHSGDE
ncbi:MAG: DUF4238 domain-containing protein [Acidobacteria bacterium]|nr:MAG: DUF4238 domain-containing protein [Acidobacteriota bacterium]